MEYVFVNCKPQKFVKNKNDIELTAERIDVELPKKVFNDARSIAYSERYFWVTNFSINHNNDSLLMGISLNKMDDVPFFRQHKRDSYHLISPNDTIIVDKDGDDYVLSLACIYNYTKKDDVDITPFIVRLNEEHAAMLRYDGCFDAETDSRKTLTELRGFLGCASSYLLHAIDELFLALKSYELDEFYVEEHKIYVYLCKVN